MIKAFDGWCISITAAAMRFTLQQVRRIRIPLGVKQVSWVDAIKGSSGLKSTISHIFDSIKMEVLKSALQDPSIVESCFCRCKEPTS